MKLYMKRALALGLSLVLAFSLLPVSIMAAGKPEIAIGGTTASTSGGAASITVPVTISNNPGFAGMDLSFSLPEGWVLENISIREKDDYSVFYAEDAQGDMSALTKPTVNPARGRFLAAHSEDISASGYLCWLSITVPADTAVGEYKLAVVANKINTAASTAEDISESYSLLEGTVSIIESGVILSESAVVAYGEKTLTATAIDSQGLDVTGEAKWSVSPANKGVSISAGVVTVGEDALPGKYLITAEGVGEATLTVYTLRVQINGEAATVSEFVYGADWEEIISGIEINDENIKVLTDRELEGRLYVKNDAHSSSIPDAGSHTYEIFFENDDYGPVGVYTGEIVIAPKTVEVNWTLTERVYNGAEQYPQAEAEGVTLFISGATNSGSYTATATTDSKNHVLSNNTCTFTILPSGEFTDATEKEQRASAGRVSFAQPVFTGFGGEKVEGKLSYSFEGEEMGYEALCARLSELEMGTVTLDYAFTASGNYEGEREGSIVLNTTGYSLHISEDIEYGSISLSADAAAEGERVYVTAMADTGYEIAEIKAVDSRGVALKTESTEEGYVFNMPADEVYVSAVFTKLGLPFTDVAQGAWYYEPIHYAYYNGLMNGISATRFEPGTNLTRAMMMTILARLAGVDTSGGSPWYEKGMVWAMENGVSDGTNPGLNITREQVVTMLYRYIGEPEVGANGLEGFVDGDTTSTWARDAMNWAIENGLMKGDDKGNVNPRNNATRAEISTIFQRFIENVMD